MYISNLIGQLLPHQKQNKHKTFQNPTAYNKKNCNRNTL